jgi:diacylglycerol kinase
LITILAIALGIYFRINTVEWSLIALAFGGLTSAELINTVIEEFIDSIVKGYDTAAKAAKDMSAGYVLINALAALAVLYFVFSQRLILALTALHVL